MGDYDHMIRGSRRYGYVNGPNIDCQKKKKKTERNWDFSRKRNKLSLNFHREFYFCEV